MSKADQEQHSPGVQWAKQLVTLAFLSVDGLAANIQIWVRRGVGRRHFRLVGLIGVSLGLPAFYQMLHPPRSMLDAQVAYQFWHLNFWFYLFRALIASWRVHADSIGRTLGFDETRPVVELAYTLPIAAASNLLGCPTIGLFLLFAWACSAFQAAMVFLRIRIQAGVAIDATIAGEQLSQAMGVHRSQRKRGRHGS